MSLHEPVELFSDHGPTTDLPFRGRPASELMMLHDTNATPICNLCNHLLERVGNEWQCGFRCRCLMMGCIPKKGGWDDDHSVSI